MEPVKKQPYFTVEEYETYEASISGRAEYRNGIIVDMVGGSKSHGQVLVNLGANLVHALKTTACIVYMVNVKAQAESANCFLYPDVSVACDEPEVSRLNSPKLKQPILIVEVLSESTALDDIGNKYFTYQQIDSLRDYVLADQHSPVVYVMHRDESGNWAGRVYAGLEAEIDLYGLGIKVAMADIYDKVVFPEDKRPLIQ